MISAHLLTFKLWLLVAFQVWTVVYACPQAGGLCICDSKSRSVTCTRISGIDYQGIPSNAQALTINKSPLKKIGPNAFKSIGSLMSVDLSNNKIEFIAENSFSDLPRLKTLSLANNRIRLLGEKVFMRSNTLIKVDLSGNHIIVLMPFNFQGLSNLEELLLLRNPTMCIAVEAFAEMPELRRLEMSGMNATLDSKLFSSLENLRVLVIRQFMHVKEMPKDIFRNNTRLEKLYLEDLSLSTEFDPMLLKPLKNLDALSLKKCRLSKIPHEMLDAVKDSLTSLDVSHNYLSTLSEFDLQNLKMLKVLNLRNTGLRSLPKKSLALKYLITLDLSGNMLTTLQKSVFGRYYKNLRNVTLGHNPWVCDCKLRWLVERRLTHSREIPVTCSDPSAMKGIDIRHASRPLPSEEYFKCEKPTIIRFGISEKKVHRLPNKQGMTEFDAYCIVEGYQQAKITWILPSFKDTDLRTRRSLPSDRNKNMGVLYSWITYAKEVTKSRGKRADIGDSKLQQDSCSLCEVSSKHTNENVWVSEDGALHARDLAIPLSLGVYTCQAVNEYGLSRKSFIITDVITPRNQADETKSSPVINAYGSMHKIENEADENGMKDNEKDEDEKDVNGNGKNDYDNSPSHYYPFSSSSDSKSSDLSSRFFYSFPSSSYYPPYSSNSPLHPISLKSKRKLNYESNSNIPLPLQAGTKPAGNNSSINKWCQRVECKTHNKIKQSNLISGSNSGGVFYQSTEGKLLDQPYYELVMPPDITDVLPSESHAPCCGNYARSNVSRMLSAFTCVLVTLLLAAPL